MVWEMIVKIRRKDGVPVISNGPGTLEVTYDECLKLAEKHDIEILHSSPNFERKGKHVIFFQDLLYKIGGIEEFLYYMFSEFKDYNITFMYNHADTTQLLRLAKFVKIQKYNGSIDCDVLILNNYHTVNLLNLSKTKCKKSYLVVHADLRGHKGDIHFKIHPKLTGYISVSQAAHDGLKDLYGIDSKIIYNFVSKESNLHRRMKFITLSRATKEKGIDRILKMAKAFKRQGKSFIWLMCGTMEEQVTNKEVLDELKNMPEMIFIPPALTNQELMDFCDYVVQLSDVESYCYSLNQALARGIPVISTDYPEAYNFIRDGENGYMFNMDLTDLDVDKIFNKKPVKVSHEDKCDKSVWTDLFMEGVL